MVTGGFESPTLMSSEHAGLPKTHSLRDQRVTRSHPNRAVDVTYKNSEIRLGWAQVTHVDSSCYLWSCSELLWAR
jgi:hypothetical protein